MSTLACAFAAAKSHIRRPAPTSPPRSRPSPQLLQTSRGDQPHPVRRESRTAVCHEKSAVTNLRLKLRCIALFLFGKSCRYAAPQSRRGPVLAGLGSLHARATLYPLRPERGRRRQPDCVMLARGRKCSCPVISRFPNPRADGSSYGSKHERLICASLWPYLYSSSLMDSGVVFDRFGRHP